MRTLTWKTIRSNLSEALGELRKLDCRLWYLFSGEVPEDWGDDDGSHKAWLARQEQNCPFTEFSLHTSLDHAYYHLNLAWNSRRTPLEPYKNCSDRTYRRWSGCPKTREFADLWPKKDVRKRLRKEPGFRKVSLTPVRVHIKMAVQRLDILCYLVAKEAGEDSAWSIPPKNLDPNVDKLPLTERDFAERMHLIYEMLNHAWNRRRDKTYFIAKYAIPRRKLFPPAFMPGCLVK